MVWQVVMMIFIEYFDTQEVYKQASSNTTVILLALEIHLNQ